MKRLLFISFGLLFAGLLFFYSSSEAPSNRDQPDTVVTFDSGSESRLKDVSRAQMGDSAAPQSSASADDVAIAAGVDGGIISIGDYIDPDRGPDFTERADAIEIGEYIDPERGADLTEPLEVVEIGDYIDPDRGALLVEDPLTVVSIGAFIDPDSLSSSEPTEVVEAGEYIDPDEG